MATSRPLNGTLRQTFESGAVYGYVDNVQALRAEIERLLAAARQSDIDHAAEIKHLEHARADEVTNLNLALNPVISSVRQRVC